MTASDPALLPSRAHQMRYRESLPFEVIADRLGLPDAEAAEALVEEGSALLRTLGAQAVIKGECGD